MTGIRWSQRPPGSNWGEFGADDQLGRLNLIDERKRLQGVAEVKAGRSFNLSLPLNLPGGNAMNERRYPPVLRPSVRRGKVNFNYLMCEEVEGTTEVFCDDVAILSLQYSTHWDSFSHVGYLFDADDDGIAEPVYYNGFRPGRDVLGPSDVSDATSMAQPSIGTHSTCFAHALGIERMAESCIQGRAVLIDLHAHLGDEEASVGWAQLSEIIAKDGVVIEKGDIVCLHTGFGAMLMEMEGHPDSHRLHHSHCALDGTDQGILDWVTDTGMACLVADNFGVETQPNPVTWRSAHALSTSGCPCAFLPLHEHCLFKLGVPLGELWHLTELANWLRQTNRSRFLLTAPPIRLPGAVGAPPSPVATV